MSSGKPMLEKLHNQPVLSDKNSTALWRLWTLVLFSWIKLS